MSQQQKLYSLQLLFDSTQITLEELKEKAEDVLHQYLPDIDLKISSTHSGSFLLALKGALEVVDSCHNKLNKNLLKPSQLKCLRLVDQAGDEIRYQAYPIVAEIEQRFRVFISQALVEVSGFDWWDTLAPSDIRNKVQTIREKHQEDGTSLDPLECTQFDDLIKIITLEVSEWSEDKQLSVIDFLELLLNCDSVAEVKTKLEEKIKKFSFWDVFSRFFEDKKKWEQIKKSITFVINERHKVMHHRPIRLGVIQALLNKKREIFTVLDSAKAELSEQERIEAQEEVKDIRETISAQTKRLNDLLMPSNSQWLTQSLLKQDPQLQAQIRALTEPTLEQYSKSAAQISAFTELIGKQEAQRIQEAQKIARLLESRRKQDLQIQAQMQALTDSLLKQKTPEVSINPNANQEMSIQSDINDSDDDS